MRVLSCGAHRPETTSAAGPRRPERRSWRATSNASIDPMLWPKRTNGRWPSEAMAVATGATISSDRMIGVSWNLFSRPGNATTWGSTRGANASGHVRNADGAPPA